jgi:RNA polymerase sigma-70 factor (ECF subfamily)
MSARPASLPNSVPDATALPVFTRVFEEQFSYVWSTLRRFGVAQSDLEDLVQEVFIRVHSRLMHYDPERPLRPWLFGIALGVASNYGRLARHRTEVVAEVPHATDLSLGADESLAKVEERALVHAALQRVPMHQRALLILHEMDGCTIPDVAAALGIGLNTAYSRLRLGREAFRSNMMRLMRRSEVR